MIEIDGAHGEGGGQILRTSLSLAMMRGEPLQMTNIRAGRRKPGMMRQHLAAVKAATQMSKAKTQGMELGSRSLFFEPTESFDGGDLMVELSSAGSTSLIFQTLLPSMLKAGRYTNLILKGGTHNPMAPCFDFLKDSFIPCLDKMGYNIELKLIRRGFYPAGGGEFHVEVKPSRKYFPFIQLQRKMLMLESATCILSKLWPGILEKELQLLDHEFQGRIPIYGVEDDSSPGPGNVVLIKQMYGDLYSVFTSFGDRNISSEKVIEEVVQEMKSFQRSSATIEPRLADQLLLPMLIAEGGEFTTSKITNHLITQAELLNQICGYKVEITQNENVRIKVLGQGCQER